MDIIKLYIYIIFMQKNKIIYLTNKNMLFENICQTT